MTIFLPGVPEPLVRDAFARAGGNEIATGKFASTQSSAALAANGIGWFLERPAALPPFPGLDDLDWPAATVSLEREMRFPWTGGRHPWLDAAVETPAQLIGVESKRFEPFRSSKPAKLAPAYDRDVWGEGMDAWCAMRDQLRSAPRTYHHLDAAQLVKHAFGLVTEARRIGKAPVLLYLFAEPPSVSQRRPDAITRHRQEVAGFASAVANSMVRFGACSWRDWLARFSNAAADHADCILLHFDP